MTAIVALIRCEDYRESSVAGAVENGLNLIGGIESLATTGETLLLKPNLLASDTPERAVTTHPAVFRAVAERLIKNGISLTYGDSPGKGNSERAARKSGIKKEADRLQIPLADFKTVVHVSYPDGLLAKQLRIAKGVLDCDGIISLAKMKTHALTRITGAIKNQFGCIPGLLKGEYHVKMPDINDFCTVLVDLTMFLRPRLYIMDAVTAMEGNGPRGGDPRAMRLLLFSKDPVALDTVFCRLIGLKPQYVPFLDIAAKAGLGTCKDNEIHIRGDDLHDFIARDFRVVRRPPDRFISARHFPPFLKSLISPKPVINRERCTRCGSCVLQCPTQPKAVNTTVAGLVPEYDYHRCIRCYCCQEICPQKAISIKTPFLGRLIRR